MNGFGGQHLLSAEVLQALAIPKKVFHYVGTTVTVIERPIDAKAKVLVLIPEADNARIKIGNFGSYDYAVDDAAEDTLSLSDHGFETGDGPFQLTTTDTLPAGSSAATNYWIIVPTDSTDTFKLATSYANAIAGTAVDITNAGTGTHTINGMVSVAESPASSDANGSGSILLNTSIGIKAFGAPEAFTIKGYDAATVVTYFWL